MATNERIQALDELRWKLEAHRRKVVDIVNNADKMDGDAMAKVALIVAIQQGLDAVKAAREQEVASAPES